MELSNATILIGQSLDKLRELPNCSIQTCITSPPYFGLRNYRVEGQIGMEETPEEYVSKLVCVFQEVRRVLRDDGTLWLNLGDSYARQAGDDSTKESDSTMKTGRTGKSKILFKSGNNTPPIGLKPKDLIGIPWKVAFALQQDNWFLRQDIIWSKGNPMPESVSDRCTKSHEYIFLLSKKAKYYFNCDAIRNPPSEALIKQVLDGYNGKSTKNYSESIAQDASATKSRIIAGARKKIEKIRGKEWDGTLTEEEKQLLGSNKRSVWTVNTKPYKGAHFATFPSDLIRPCILAGSRPGDLVLDCFAGSGTLGQVALEEGRKTILIELNPDYLSLIEDRVKSVKTKAEPVNWSTNPEMTY